MHLRHHQSGGLERIGPSMPIVALLVSSVVVVAQFQVSRQMNVGGGPPSVRYASSSFASAPFGSNPYFSNPYASALYGPPINRSAPTMLPVQQSYVAMRSGAMPAQVQMNYAQASPMAPSGSINYLPRAAVYPSQRSAGYSAAYPPQQSVPTGNMAYSQPVPPSTMVPHFASPSAGSVKYATGQQYQSSLTPTSSLGLAAKDGVGSGSVPHTQPLTGSIRYGSQ